MRISCFGNKREKCEKFKLKGSLEIIRTGLYIKSQNKIPILFILKKVKLLMQELNKSNKCLNIKIIFTHHWNWHTPVLYGSMRAPEYGSINCCNNPIFLNICSIIMQPQINDLEIKIYEFSSWVGAGFNKFVKHLAASQAS